MCTIEALNFTPMDVVLGVCYFNLLGCVRIILLMKDFFIHLFHGAC